MKTTCRKSTPWGGAPPASTSHARRERGRRARGASAAGARTTGRPAGRSRGGRVAASGRSAPCGRRSARPAPNSTAAVSRIGVELGRPGGAIAAWTGGSADTPRAAGVDDDPRRHLGARTDRGSTAGRSRGSPPGERGTPIDEPGVSDSQNAGTASATAIAEPASEVAQRLAHDRSREPRPEAVLRVGRLARQKRKLRRATPRRP